jgi:hypothetical protein
MGISDVDDPYQYQYQANPSPAAPATPAAAPATAPAAAPAAFQLSKADQKDLAALTAYRDGLTKSGKPAVDPDRTPGMKEEKKLSRAEMIQGILSDDAAPAAPAAPPAAPATFSASAPAEVPLHGRPVTREAVQPSALASIPTQPNYSAMASQPQPNRSVQPPPGAPGPSALHGPIVYPGAPQPGAPPAASSDQSFGSPGAGGAHVVPAHTVQTVDPGIAAEEQAGFARRAQDVGVKGELEARQAEQVGAAKESLVGAGQQRAVGMQADIAGQQARLDPIEQNQIRLAQERAAMQLSDPDKRGTAHKITDAIAQGLSALGMGLLHQSGPNPITQQINAEIDREVERQKEEFARQGAKLNDASNIFAQVYKRTGDENAAKDAARQVQYGAVKDHIDAVATSSGSPVVIANAQIMKDQVAQEATGRKLAESQRVQAQTVGASYDPDKRARDLFDESAKSGHALSPREAMRIAVLQGPSHKDPFPQDGPLPDFSAVAPAKGGAATPIDPTRGLPNLPTGPNTEADRVRAWAKSLSTEWSPISRNKQGTEEHERLLRQGAYNGEVSSFAKTHLGLRGADAKEAAKSFVVSSGDSPETIVEKRELFDAAQRAHPFPAGKGGPSEEEPEGAP